MIVDRHNCDECENCIGRLWGLMGRSVILIYASQSVLSMCIDINDRYNHGESEAS